MNKKIYKGYELIKAIEDEQIEEGTILTFTSTIAKDTKKEVEVIRRPEGLILFKKDTLEILPTSWLFNSKIEILEDNTEEIEELKRTENVYDMTLECYHDIEKKISNDELADKINEIIRYIKRKDKNND